MRSIIILVGIIVFWRRRRKNKEVDRPGLSSEDIELPPLEELEQWVLKLIVKLGLKRGTFTFLPGYGGVLLFVRNQGLAWIPYSEIRDALGNIDVPKLVENTAIAGGGAAAVATGASGGVLLPALLVPRILKGSYRIVAQPSPNIPMSFLQSMIDKVLIEQKQLRKRLLNTFEKVPIKNEVESVPDTYVITIKRKFFDQNNDSLAVKIKKGMVSFISGPRDPIFAIPSEKENLIKFADILKNHGIEVKLVLEETDIGSNNKIEKSNENL